jgi:hypothetical protein
VTVSTGLPMLCTLIIYQASSHMFTLQCVGVRGPVRDVCTRLQALRDPLPGRHLHLHLLRAHGLCRLCRVHRLHQHAGPRQVGCVRKSKSGRLGAG